MEKSEDARAEESVDNGWAGGLEEAEASLHAASGRVRTF